MSAPARKPSYYDWGPDSADPKHAVPFLINSFAVHPKYFPDWIIEDSGIPVDLHVVAHEENRSCTIGFVGGGISGTVTFAADPSDWVLVTAEVGGAEVFRGYLDRPYEQYEIWPVGATPGDDDEAPGRIGKRETWVGFNTANWPAAAALADERGHFFCIVDEERLRVRMDSGG